DIGVLVEMLGVDEVLDPADLVVGEPFAQGDGFAPAAHRHRAGLLPPGGVPAWIDQQVAIRPECRACRGDELAVAALVLAEHAPAELDRAEPLRDITARGIRHCLRLLGGRASDTPAAWA